MSSGCHSIVQSLRTACVCSVGCCHPTMQILKLTLPYSQSLCRDKCHLAIQPLGPIACFETPCAVLPGGVARSCSCRGCWQQAIERDMCCMPSAVVRPMMVMMMVACCRCVQIQWWAATLCVASQEGNASVSPRVRVVRCFSSVAMHLMISCCCRGSKAAHIGVIHVTHADQWSILLKERHGKIVIDGIYRYQACSSCHCSISAIGVRAALARVLVHAIVLLLIWWSTCKDVVSAAATRNLVTSSTLVLETLPVHPVHLAWQCHYHGCYANLV